MDSLLEGGFIPGRTYLITGDAGTGKTTACMQFLLTGLQNSEKAVYVTVDERPAEILQSSSTLDWDLQTHVENKSLVILDAAPYFGGRGAIATEKAMDLERIVSDLASYAKRLEAVRLAIDPVTPLIFSADSQPRVHEQARMLIHLLQSHLTTTNLLTAHLASHRSTGGIEEFLASGVIILSVEQVGDRLVRTLRIKKMRGTAVKPSDHRFNIVKGAGLVLETADGTPIVEEEPLQALEIFQLPKKES